MNGADLLAALENGVSQIEDTAGRFPQVSGLSFVFDATGLPARGSSRSTVGGAPLDPAGTYRLATNDYLLGGGDGYASLKGAKAIIDRSAGRLLASTVMNYITALGGEVDAHDRRADRAARLTLWTGAGRGERERRRVDFGG